MFTQLEKIDMVFCYGEAEQNSVQACTLYAAKYPDRVLPVRRTMDNVIKLFRETGSVQPAKKNRVETQTHEGAEIAVLAAVRVDPHVSSRQIARYSGISKSSILRILKRHKFHPYHISMHQALEEQDFQNRINFCRWAQRQLQADERFFENVLFSDESTFTNHGEVNTHNMHYWSDENPRWLRQVVHQRPWSVNVWCGIWNDRIIGPFFIDGNLNGKKYADMLTDQLPELLEDIPLEDRQLMWYQHDGCPAHFAHISRAVLNRKFPGKWIGRGAQVCWPARSPDLTPLDFFLWGLIKDIVYRDVPTTRDNMKERIVNACASITPEMISRASQSFIMRIDKCIQVDGQHFEHLIK